MKINHLLTYVINNANIKVRLNLQAPCSINFTKPFKYYTILAKPVYGCKAAGMLTPSATW